MIDVRPLKTEADYDIALKAVAMFFENEPTRGTPEADRFGLLALVISDYEAKHWSIAAVNTPTPGSLENTKILLGGEVEKLE